MKYGKNEVLKRRFFRHVAFRNLPWLGTELDLIIGDDIQDMVVEVIIIALVLFIALATSAVVVRRDVDPPVLLPRNRSP